jgi:hypothetical protein
MGDTAAPSTIATSRSANHGKRGTSELFNHSVLQNSLAILRDFQPTAYLLGKDAAASTSTNDHAQSRNIAPSSRSLHPIVKRRRIVPLMAQDNLQEEDGDGFDDDHSEDLASGSRHYLYGNRIPPAPKTDLCARCERPTEGAECSEDVLLCDGAGCGREFHLGCCVPSLLEIPEGSWLCQDCSPTGSTETLRAYLDHMGQRRSERSSRVENLFSLIVEDADRVGIARADIPASELEQVSAFHAAAMGDPPSLQSSSSSKCPAAATPKKLSGAAAALSPASSGAAAVSAPSSCASGSRPLNPAKVGQNFFVGKPVRLYDDLHDHFHTGRIVDSRRTHEDGITDVECLVRFVAGSNDRKEASSYWIALEEHNLSVGTTLVYAKLPASGGAGAAAGRKGASLKDRKSPTSLSTSSSSLLPSSSSSVLAATPARAGRKESRWVPAMVWLRSTRALLSLYGINSELKTLKNAVGRKNSNKALWGAVRPFGSKDMVECDLVRHAVDFASPAAYGAAAGASDNGDSGSGGDGRHRILNWLALAELHAQERVRRWHSLPLRNNRHPLALTSRDEYGLGPLVPVNAEFGPEQSSPQHAQLCPLVSPGLSRARLVQLMRQHHHPETAAAATSTTASSSSLEPSKDAASTLAIRIVGLSSFETVLQQQS